MEHEEYHDKLNSILGVALGRASMAWSQTPHSVFDSSHAVRILHETKIEIDLLVDRYVRDLNKEGNNE